MYTTTKWNNVAPTDEYAGIISSVYDPLGDYIGPNQRMWLLGYNVKNTPLSRMADSKKIIQTSNR